MPLEREWQAKRRRLLQRNIQIPASYYVARDPSLEEATRELASCRSPDRATQLVILVREAATSLATLRHILCDTL